MGTRYEDQPPEQWAGPESLDPTPVWKQYILVALLLVVGLVVIVAVVLTALAPQFVTPPALVPGQRLVLSAAEVPAVDRAPKLIGAPILDDARSFYLIQPEKGRVLALRTHWEPHAGAPDCPLAYAGPSDVEIEQLVSTAASQAPQIRAALQRGTRFIARCPGGVAWTFDVSGQPGVSGGTPTPPRGLDQYLVSVSGDRVIINLSRVIEASERTIAPVPTGIPQPQQP